ncbi:hypothetical protein [Priestia megaterium]|uniref:hypothetical protein n=1 Tax=Priestia megaterium TaxID=1404 RepID=UPI002E1C6860|nr:hypothetical protein [Priestia megaterium]MED4275281.1 hypothetical protein [Priestia megaterium]MED4315407.1 hypothetical protein [Priestia megaterium]
MGFADQLRSEEISIEVKLELLKICNNVINSDYSTEELIKEYMREHNPKWRWCYEGVYQCYFG